MCAVTKCNTVAEVNVILVLRMSKSKMDETLDDMTLAIMSMGFDLQDALDAVQYGYIYTQEAVEWILNGKPGFTAHGSAMPSLKLHESHQGHSQSTCIHPDMTMCPPLLLPSDTDAINSVDSVVTCSSMNTEHYIQDVSSRFRLSVEKQNQKCLFEIKEKKKALKRIQDEKTQAKKERERVRNQIMEDNEVHKMKRLECTTGSHRSSTVSACSSTGDTTTIIPTLILSDAHVTVDTMGKSSIQIRYPCGRVLRMYRDRNSTLGQLLFDVKNDTFNDGIEIIQPYPFRTFSALEVGRTLEELGLTPSCSLVVRRVETLGSTVQITDSQLPVDSGSSSNVCQGSVPERSSTQCGESFSVSGVLHRICGEHGVATQQSSNLGIEGQPGVSEVGRHRPQRFVGRGHSLMDDEADDNDQSDEFRGEVNENDGSDVDVGGADIGFHGNVQGFGRYANFGGTNNNIRRVAHLGWPLFPHNRRGGHHAFGGVGQRLVPVYDQRDADQLHQPVAHLAGEAAQHRSLQALSHEDLPNSVSVSHIPAPILALQDSCFGIVLEQLISSKCNRFTFGSIPENITQKFLSHLIENKLLNPKTMHIFSKCYFHKLVLDTYCYTTNELLYAVGFHINLRILSLRSCPIITDQGLRHIAGLSNLKSLDLGLCNQLTDGSLDVIKGLLNVQVLCLEETGVTDHGLVHYFKTKPCLTCLNLRRTSVTDICIPHLWHLSQLLFLSLEGTDVRSLQGIDQSGRLSALNVSYTNITADSLLCLQSLQHLSKLNIGNNPQLDGGSALQNISALRLRELMLPDRLTIDSASLRHLTTFSLECLDLTNFTSIDDEGMAYVGKIVQLETLILTNTRITDDGLMHLKGLTFLKSLYLDRTAVTDNGVGSIKDFRFLRELSLASTLVSNEFLMQKALHCCPDLLRLNLSHTNVGDKGIVHLKLPHLELLNLDGTMVHEPVVEIVYANCPALRNISTVNFRPIDEPTED